MGQVGAWFREGTKDKNNQGVHAEYLLPRDEIVATHPASDEHRHSKKGPFALAVTGLLCLVFVYYLMQQFRFCNMQRLDFWGLLFTVNLLILIGMIFAFWFFYINLIQLMYVFVCYSPIALFLFNRGLMAGNANCKVD